MLGYKTKHLFGNGSRSLCETPVLFLKSLLLGIKLYSVQKQNPAAVFQKAIFPPIARVLRGTKKTHQSLPVTTHEVLNPLESCF